MYLQDLIFTLSRFWADRGCVIEQPVDVEVGAGTFHPATFLRVLGPEPWNAAFVQFCRRPSDGRYGENPNRAGAYYQFQVGLKPSPLHVQDLYLDSLRAIGLDPAAHDIRFVEDDWESPTLGAWGLGWEVWCDGMEVTQFTYFQQAGGIDLMPVTAELTYGIERLCMYLQNVDNMYDLKWDRHVTYGQIRKPWEVEYSTYHFAELDPSIAFAAFDTYERECNRLLESNLVLPAYEFCMKSSHQFNTLDARGAISVTERQRFIGRVRAMARACAHAYVASRARLSFPLLPPAIGAAARAAYDGAAEAGVNAGALAAARVVAPYAEELPVPADLLFEIGCEEIPAKMVTRALAELPDAITAKLAAARLTHGAVHAFGTPRRLAVIVKQLVDRQPDLHEDVVGPPASAAFAPDGSLTKAGQGFAAKNGVAPSALLAREVAGKKGQYVVASRHVVGGETRALLPEILRELAAAIPWPKSMRWGWRETGFVRPVQWLVALYGGEVVALDWAGMTAGRKTRGHRFLSPGWIEVASADAYVDALKAAHVVVDPEARTTLVRAELARLERETGCRVRPDEGLIAEVIQLGEYPVGVSGSFDPSYLEVPEEIIVTAMRNHQRYFAMEDAHGKLAPRFVTLMATVVKDPRVVARGNETVIASRLADAKFFFAEDRKRTFAEWNRRLDGVVFQAKLGDAGKTIGDKLRRLGVLVAALADDIAGDRAIALRAAELCKADLASTAVGEFPELQGVMGRHYAAIAGEPAAVATAIEQHWWPKGQGAALPETPEAALVAIADRIDTLVGCFATGLVPSGNADPLGLRRAAIGVLAILLDRGPGGARAGKRFVADLDRLIDASAAAYGTAVKLSPEAREQLREFMRARLRGILIEDEKLEPQAVDVALGARAVDPSDARARARDLAVVPADVRAAFKRIGNILDDARGKGFGTQVSPDPARFTSPVEGNLWTAFRGQGQLAEWITGKRYRESFAVLATLGPHLAAFFDKGGVMVMDPDPALRENRLALLHAIYDPFLNIGDFRKLGGGA